MVEFKVSESSRFQNCPLRSMNAQWHLSARRTSRVVIWRIGLDRWFGWSRWALGCQVRLEKPAVADVMFAITIVLNDVLPTVLTEADNSAMICPSLCVWMLYENRLTRIEDGQFVAMLVWILILTNLTEAAFNFCSKEWLVMVNWSRQAVTDFATE